MLLSYKNISLVLSRILLLTLMAALGLQAAEVEISPDNINRITDFDTASADRNYLGTFSVWDGSNRYWHTLLDTSDNAFTTALTDELGALGAGQSYQINSAKLIVGSLTAASRSVTFNSPNAEAYVVTTSYNPANVTFNDSDTGDAADWVDGTFTAGGADFTSSNYSGQNLITSGVFTQTGSSGSDIYGYTTFTFNNSMVQGWIDGTAPNLVFNGGDITHWSSETSAANVKWVVDAAIIPEPGSYALFAGTAMLLYVLRRVRRS